MKRKAANKAKSSSSTIDSESVSETTTINTSSAVDAKVNKANISSFMDSENDHQSSALQIQSSSSSSTHPHDYVHDSELLSQPIAEYRNSSNSSSSEPGNPNITSTDAYEGNLLYSNKHANQSHMRAYGPFISSNTNTSKRSLSENNSSGTYNDTHPEHISSAIPYFQTPYSAEYNSNSSSSSIPNYSIQTNFDPVLNRQDIAPYGYHDSRYTTYNASSNVPNDNTNNIYISNTSYTSNSNIYTNLTGPTSVIHQTSLPNTSSSDIVNYSDISNILYQHPTPGSAFIKYYDDEVQKPKKKKSENK